MTKPLFFQAHDITAWEEYILAISFLSSEDAPACFELSEAFKAWNQWLNGLPTAIARELCFEIIRRDRFVH